MKALRAARLFDGVTDRLVRSPLVMIDDGVIVEVMEHATPPHDLPVTDLGDVTFLPGLVDAHVHLVFPGVPDQVAAVNVPIGQLLENARRAASTCLDVGVTTARDLGDRDYVTLLVRAETALTPTAGPHLLTSGPPITPPGGHCWFLGSEAQGADQLAWAVDERISRGSDVVKIMASGGEITAGSRSWEVQYTLEDLRAVVAQAHASGVPVAAHAHAVKAIENALRADVDTIEHASFRRPDGVRPDLRLMDALAWAGTAVTVTTGFSPTGPPLDAAADSRIARTLATALMMRDAGVKIVCASDAGISDQKPHGLLPHSIIRLSEAGFAPFEALRAATSSAADACGALVKGRLARGYDADLVAVAGDPCTDITALLQVRSVYRAGERVRDWTLASPRNKMA